MLNSLRQLKYKRKLRIYLSEKLVTNLVLSYTKSSNIYNWTFILLFIAYTNK